MRKLTPKSNPTKGALRAKLLLDEDVDVRLADWLIGLGHDVVTVCWLGQCGIADQVVLTLAAQSDRAVVTRNRSDCYALHTADTHHAGTVLHKDISSADVDSFDAGQTGMRHDLAAHLRSPRSPYTAVSWSITVWA